MDSVDTRKHTPSEYHILNKDVTTHHLGQDEVGFQCQGKLESNSITAVCKEWYSFYYIYLMSERLEDL